MYCIDCGAQLPDEARFCWKCGEVQKGDVRTEEQWETCEIVYAHVNYGSWSSVFSLGLLGKNATDKFWAKVIGREGVYSAGESEEFLHFTSGPYSGDDKTIAAWDALVAKLVKDGWQPTDTSGVAWYNKRFRRPVKKRTK